MRKTLVVLTASFILLVSSFTFSSCKNCDGNKGKDSGEANPVTDIDKNNSNNGNCSLKNKYNLSV